MRVVVTSPSEDSLAHKALSEEGVEHDLLLCVGQLDYGEHFARLWREGEGFIHFEWDVIPRPGVVTRLANCKHDWCGWPYDDIDPSVEEPVVNVGCMKFGARLLGEHPDLPEYWEGVGWESVEPNVRAALNEMVAPYPHMHGGGKWTKAGLRATAPLEHLKAG